MAMGLVRRCTDFAPEYAVISYTNASFWDQVTEFPVRYSERVYAAGAERARAVFAATDPAGDAAGRQAGRRRRMQVLRLGGAMRRS